MFCIHCGKQIVEGSKFCTHCGQPVMPSHTGTAHSSNTSGQGSAALVPSEIKGWNWGAFGLNWIWSIGNETYIGLLALIPFVSIVMAIILGIKGNEWAWQNKKWDSVEHFKKTQRKWTIAWLIVLAVGILLAILMVTLVVFAVKTAPQQPYNSSYYNNYDNYNNDSQMQHIQ